MADDNKKKDPKKERKNSIIISIIFIVGAFLMPKLMEGKVYMLFYVIPLNGTVMAIIMGLFGVVGLLGNLKDKNKDNQNQE